MVKSTIFMCLNVLDYINNNMEGSWATANTTMNTTRPQFSWLLEEHCRNTGVVMPGLLTEYLAALLDSRLTRVDIIPDPSFAERYLLLNQRPTVAGFVDYADSCLFFTALMPEYGLRRGLNMDYYATLGISGYYTAGDLSEDLRYTQLGNWFYTLQRVLNTAIHPEVRLELFNI